ncbi:STM4015 family protein [Sinosporangium siamense]|uniref:Leucine-rich repeat domain-containing protein n=1 Tax=Sinosporangium siamense TaxID=1367973 RepID=A0A919RB46_9ACTN|nr:STM4015 family protein [Sinosporangium siamense]GII90443.1 hypothetical protein Ssi02_06740 [Sinosporangium siamense]
MEDTAFYGDVSAIDKVYAGLPVVSSPEDDETPLPPARGVAWRVAADIDGEVNSDDFATRFERLLRRVDPARIQAIVVGMWAEFDGSSAEVVSLLAEAADRLPALRSIFLGAIPQEENEISWIEQSDITPLLTAFPQLERLDVRGGNGVSLAPLRHESLRVLRFETGGLPVEVPRAVLDCDLPALRHLDLWLGSDNYGCTVTVTDLGPLLSGERLPALTHLGLENSEFQDDIALAVAHAPIVARLESLSLALGALSDEGAAALLSGQPLTHLKRLDLRHHFLSPTMAAKVESTFGGTGVDLKLGDRCRSYGNDSRRYITVSE